MRKTRDAGDLRKVTTNGSSLQITLPASSRKFIKAGDTVLVIDADPNRDVLRKGDTIVRRIDLSLLKA